MCKIFRPGRNFDPVSSFVWISIALSGPLIYIFIRPEYAEIFAFFTLVFGIAGYADGRLSALKICDDRIALSRWWFVVWHSNFDDSYAMIDYPLCLTCYEKASGRELRSIHLSPYTMEDIDEMITALRMAGALRES